jgi:methionyl-tRNA formyltransferase
MFIQILVDNPNSWIIPYAHELKNKLITFKHNVKLIHLHNEVRTGDILCLLSCEKMFSKLELNKHNLVVHESDLPKGKGWSPLTWQVLEGANTIPISLFEAAESVDSGPIYGKLKIELDGTELIDELRQKQATKTIDLILDFVKKYPNNLSVLQKGESTYFKRRKPEDSKLDIQKSLISQFNLLRVCDNEKYPAYFEINGIKYTLKIEKNDTRY